MTLANNGMALMAKRILNKSDDYDQLAKTAGLSTWPIPSYCFVTGYGTLTPQSTHHRPSEALGTTMIEC